MSSSDESDSDRHSSTSSKRIKSSSSSKRKHYSSDEDSSDDDRKSSSSRSGSSSTSSKRSKSSSTSSSKSAPKKAAPIAAPSVVKLDRDQFFKICEDYRRPPTLKGGLSAHYKKKPSDFSNAQLYRGLHIEMFEHGGNSPNVALAIAMDHLTEIPDYYKRLGEMEAAYKAERRAAGL
jgi:hypothetical protein